MKNYALHFLFLLGILNAWTCNTTKNAVPIDGCEQTAIVVDFSDLDGCTNLILLPDGTKLLPASFPKEDQELTPGERIQLTYTTAEAMASICMAENAAANISCLTIFESNQPSDCLNVGDLKGDNWLSQELKRFPSEQILKHFVDGKEWIYQFTGKSNRFYHCSGQLLCETSGINLDHCSYINFNGPSQVIFQGLGNNE